MAKGRKQEKFEINFNQDVELQLRNMSLKHLLKLLICIFQVIPSETFGLQEYKDDVGNIFSQFGQVLRKEVSTKIEAGAEESKSRNNWTKAESRTYGTL